jgi:copper oxidase (laccase) domain-containing protein
MVEARVDPSRLVTAEQVHGNDLRVAGAAEAGSCLSGCDGLIASEPGVVLGIYVADCAAVFVTHSKRRVAALLHSGKRGTELGILPRTIDLLQREHGCDPGDLVVEVSPCIRPPHYDVDFAAQLERQAVEAGVGRYHDEGRCTGSDLQNYYSYRIERGKTGRMLALLEILA